MLFNEKEPLIDKKAFAQLVFNQIASITDEELSIIKGHLLIEYALNKYIDTVSEWSKSIDETNFTFSHKIQICSILGLFIGENSSLENDIILFNKLRNQVAHKLSYDRGLLTNFINRQKFVNDAILKFGDTPTDLKLLQGGIIYICGQIARLIETRHEFDADTRAVMIEKVIERRIQKLDDHG